MKLVLLGDGESPYVGQRYALAAVSTTVLAAKRIPSWVTAPTTRSPSTSRSSTDRNRL